MRRVVTGEQGGSVTEDATLVASGQIVVADADAGQSGTQAANLAGTYGDLAVDAAGHWSYTLRNADANVQALHQGEQVHDDFTVLAADGTPITVAISVNGANETPLAQALDASGSEGAAIPVTLGGSDIDGTIASFTLTALPEHGTLMLRRQRARRRQRGAGQCRRGGARLRARRALERQHLARLQRHRQRRRHERGR